MTTLVRIPQAAETAVTTDQNEAFAWRYAYARAAESQAADESGQDFLTFRLSDQACAFALCDGVSQSFYGDIAARALGEALLAWLGEALPATLEADALRQSLAARLEALTATAGAAVQAQQLPSSIPPLLRDVLEAKRELGSEAVFVCGGVELPGPHLPSGRLVLAWMGDARLRLWGSAGEIASPRIDNLDDGQRWSTRRGLVGGPPNLLARPLLDEPPLLAILAYSDGLPALDRCHVPPTTARLNELIAAAQRAPTSDDISLFEVWLDRARGEAAWSG